LAAWFPTLSCVDQSLPSDEKLNDFGWAQQDLKLRSGTDSAENKPFREGEGSENATPDDAKSTDAGGGRNLLGNSRRLCLPPMVAARAADAALTSYLKIAADGYANSLTA